MPELKRQATMERLRNLNDQELADELANERRRLFNLRRENVTRQLDNVAAITHTRKQIARLLTLQTKRKGQPGE